MRIFKIEYHWYEGEYDYNILVKDVSHKEFEKDLIKAKEFAESIVDNKIKEGDYLGKGYCIVCLPEFYEQIIWYLKNKLNYIDCYFDEYIKYSVSDDMSKKISISRGEKNIKWTNLKK